MLFLLILAILAIWLIGKFLTVATALIIAGIIILALVIKGVSSPEFRQDIQKIGDQVKSNPELKKWLIIFVVFMALLGATPYIIDIIM